MINYVNDDPNLLVHAALRLTLEHREIDFNKNYLICPIFSTRQMKSDDTLQISANDKTGHWLLLMLDFSSSTVFFVDSLERNNNQVSENAVLGFTKKVLEAFSFYRQAPVFREEDDQLEYIPIQTK